MRSPDSRVLVVAALILGSSAWPLGPSGAGAEADQAQLEITLGHSTVPGAEFLEWELLIDGAPVTPRQGMLGTGAWSGVFAPGRHTVGVRVRYRRDMKTLVDRLAEDRVGLTFVAGGPRWLGQESVFDVPPASLVRLAARLDEDPQDVSDRLVLALEQRPLARRPKATAPRWQGQFDVPRLVQERVSWVAALLSRRQATLAGRGGEVAARLEVDARGYLTACALEGTSGSPDLDRAAEEALRLGQPYPRFEGPLRVTVAFLAAGDAAPDDGLALSPLTRLPAYLRAR